VRQRLQMRHSEPSLVIIRRTWSGGYPVTFARLQHPGSRYELTGNYAPQDLRAATAGQVVELEKLQR
ncbi:MAG: hypothetical protein OEM25_03380, partial [Gammaproteobacteria bacterium]|nr:hypothetical protein [Gammaproteobacteria bacterium]